HTVSERDTTRAAYAGLGTIANRKDHAFAVAQRHDFDAALPSRPAARENELAAFEVARRIGEQERRLQWKHFLAVEILVQTVVIASAVAQQQRRRFRLSACVTALEIRGVPGGKTRRARERVHPAIRNGREAFVQRTAQRRDERRQRIREVL